jgi:acetolactate synthase-1/2/3 large subunit
MVKVSDLIAEFLKEKKIDTVFGIIGSANSHIFDSIERLGYTKIICTHHEQAAVMAMGAYYRASGRMSAAIVTAGAGASNAITGVVSNWADSIPGFIISGQESSGYLKSHLGLRMFGTQGFHAYKMVEDVTKYSNVIMDAETIQDELETLYNISTSGRPGPTWLDIPFDIQSKQVQSRDWKHTKSKSIRVTDAYTYVDEIIKLINASERPVVLGGAGVKLSGSKSKFQQFINATNIPALLTWSGIDLLPTQHKSHFGRFGLYGQRAANFVVQNSDLVIVLGSRLALPQVGYDFSQFARDAKIIVIDIDENELYKHPRTIKYNHDCSIVLEMLLENLNKLHLTQINTWVDRCNKYREDYPILGENYKNDKYPNSYSFVNKLTQTLADTEIIVTDMGTGLLSGHQACDLKENQTMFTSQGLGEMGVGLPLAIGAAFAEPSKPITCLNCDGGIMMNLQELQTIVQHQLPIKIFVFNNDGYLMIKHTQKMLFKGKYNAVNKETGIVLPDFKKMAFGFDLPYLSITKLEDLDTIKYPTSPCLIEVFMDPEQDFIPKVKGVAVASDDSIFAPPLEEMSPLLSLEVIEREMVVPISEKSKQIKR